MDRIRRDTALAKGTVEPDAAHLALAALSHDIKSISRMRGNHNTVDNAGDRSQVGIATLALDLARIRINRKHLEPGTTSRQIRLQTSSKRTYWEFSLFFDHSTQADLD